MQADTAYHAYDMSLYTRTPGWSSEDTDALCKAAYVAHLKKDGVYAYSKL